MKLWKVLARSSHIYNANYTAGTDLHELQCRSPTLSDDSGKHSAPSVHSDTLSHGIALSYGAGTRDTAVTVVELRKNKGEPLGIVLATGPSDLGTCPSIASFKAGSTAQRSDQLAPGDRVRSVNGINTARMRPEELGSLLDNVLGETATLEVEYTLPDYSKYSSQGSLCVTSKVTSVTLERVDGSLGITMRGGMHATDPMLSKPLVVTHVRPHGPAHRSGRIKVGDRLIKVDSHSLANKTPLEAQQLLKQPNDCSKIGQLGSSLSTLTIEYDVSIMESVKYATGPLLVEIERHMNEDLGLILSNCCDFGPDEIMSAGIYIESIIPASIADRCGALHVGDQILAVDDTYLEGSSATPQEVTWLLQNYNNTQNCTQLQIMPYHSLANGSNNSGGPGQCGWIERGIGPPCSPSISGFSTINSRKSRSRQRFGRNSAVPKSFDVDNANCTVTNANTPTGYGSRLGVCHVETLTVVLQPDEHAGYGLLVNTDGAGDQQQANIIITHINHDSPAYRCGCLQVGDRIISINGQCSLTVQEVRALLELGNSTTGNRLIVQTEFDVADTVVPASGVFTVKLAKSGPDLGITITASKTIPDDPFLISDIRRGSAAHRTGTLHIGDHVLAIDNRQLDHVGLDAAFEMVQNSQSDIVTLRIQKGDEVERQTAVAEQPEEIVYTVELNRRGGPLGITVSGSEDRSEPIVLSALTQGGLAEKTGALHVGDRILAINGETLEQRPLSDAIRLLQTSGDKVQLKIARQIKNGTDGDTYPIFQEPRGNYSSPGLASIDSAVESWDSGVIESSNSDSQTSKDTSFDCKKPDVIQHSTPDEVQSQYSLKKHESQLLFYSDVEDSICPSPLPLPNYNFTNTLQSKYDSSSYFFCSKPSLSSRNDFKYHKDMDAYSETTTPDLEIHHVTLHKDSVYDDYGFSVSDGLYEKGVYINRIRRGGPAHLAGMLRPYDRILQVNDTRTKDFDCCLTVPLIASAGDKIELVIARNPYIGCPEEKDIHVLSWTPDEPDLPRISTNSFSSSQNTITKTL